MSAVNALAQDYALAAHIKRVSEAAGWVDAARPIVKAYLALGEVVDDLDRHETPPKEFFEQAHATVAINGAAVHLYDLIESIRDRFIEDASVKQPTSAATDEEWDERDEANDALDAETLTVDQVIKRIEREDQ